MHRNSRIIIILICLAICGILFCSSQYTFASAQPASTAKAVVIGFIDSGIAPCNLNADHILEGKNYVFPDGDTVDRIGHGTKTAGMVIGSSDGSIAGTCPDAYVVPLVVVDKYTSGATKNGGTKALIAAIRDAVDVFDCDIVNISLSTTENSSELKEAVDHANEKGAIIICAAGNDPESMAVYYPAHYDNVITVGASDGIEVASFSTSADADFFYEGTKVEVVSNKKGKAPSVDSGSSFSCACVSGICAGWLMQDPALTLEEMRSLLVKRCAADTVGVLRPFDEDVYALSSDEIGCTCSDVEGLWCESAVDYAVKNSLVDPVVAGTFRPDENTTRAVVVNALYRLSGAPKVSCSKVFGDVAADAWYSESVAWAASAGIVSGYTNGNFGPDDNITREQLCTVFCQYAAYEGIDLPDNAEKIIFVDQDDISGYARIYVAVCQQAGIVSGKPGRVFDPKGNATRGQFCAMLMNFTD